MSLRTLLHLAPHPNPAVDPAKSAALSWRIFDREDHSLNGEEDQHLRHLLRVSFPFEKAFSFRRYLKNPPEHRWFAVDPEGHIVAHVGVHIKTLGTALGELTVGGISEVCVKSDYRGRGILKELLGNVHPWLRARQIPFALLFGQPPIYRSSGYLQIYNPIQSTNGLARHWNPFCGKPMIKPLSDHTWPAGAIDLRGPTF
jgi:GNAT superfamily N-acetyltransferase